MWVVHTVGRIPVGNCGAIASIHWMEITTPDSDDAGTPPVLRQENYYDSGCEYYSMHYYFPTITPDGQGNVLMAYNRSSSKVAPEIMLAGRRLNHPLRQMSASIRIQRSCACKYEFFRWGDYSGISFDPLRQDQAFIGLELVRRGNSWGTHIARVRMVRFGGQPSPL